MKKLSTFLLLLLVSVGFNTAFGQDPTPLYAGARFSSILTEYDTTGGAWATVGTTPMTSDAGSVNGVYGLAMDPTTEIMYVLYQNSSPFNRRLGTLDTESGSISDIGIAGDFADMDFDDEGNLYAMENSWDGSYRIYELDVLTGSPTFTFDPPLASWGSSTLMYDPFNDEFIRMGSESTSEKINLDAGTSSSFGGYQNDIQAGVVLNATTASYVRYGTRYNVNTVTGSVTYITGLGINCHALAFSAQPCEELIITASGEGGCFGDEYTLTAESLTGGEITWTGGIEDGVPFDPGSPGTYTYTPISDSEGDCPVDGPVTIEVVGLPTVLAGAGDLVFCEDESITLSAAGDADVYVWNDGEDLDLMPGVGTYTYELFGEYIEGFCLGENTDEVTVEVVALPTITASASDDPICINMEVTLTGGGGEMYWWDNGVVDGEAYIPATIGTTTYTVIGTDENGCSNEASVDVEVVDMIVIDGVTTIETVGDDGEIEITISGGAPAYTFDWDNDGTGDFDDDEDLTGLSAGDYTVLVKGTAGCESERTFTVKGQVGIDDLTTENVAVYPNPTTEFINIEFTGTFQYELVAINGDILFAGSATDKEVLGLKDFADGVYFINVNNETATTTIKVVKK